tara:strand:- start:11 stop:118 length:108 start_codon:yes stop_codon:yes gene_type:complete
MKRRSRNIKKRPGLYMASEIRHKNERARAMKGTIG